MEHHDPPTSVGINFVPHGLPGNGSRRACASKFRNGPTTMAAMRVPLWLKIGWTVWVIAWVPFYWTQCGLQNFLFFCDLGNLFLMLALWLESPLIFSWQATGLLLFQSLYAIDLAGALSTGSHIVGGTEYMFDPNVSLFIRLLRLFHVAPPPLPLWACLPLG